MWFIWDNSTVYIAMGKIPQSPCPWDETSYLSAVVCNDMFILQWLRSQDPPCPRCEYACTYAASCGKLHFIAMVKISRGSFSME